MKQNKTYILQVVLSTMLFFTFSMMHEFDWLIPASPAASPVATSSIPMPDIIEEPGSEDEIEHEDGYTIISDGDNKYFRTSLNRENLYIPPVPLPPPDMV
ncbi:hypothetical protein [Gracilimonas sp.]|uniref:hypothetical protein n=1 Tax=Gracilimonas sp. TaxID=1974203 RepID=UPI0032EB1F76